MFAGTGITLELVKAGEIRGTYTRPARLLAALELLRFRLFELSADGTKVVATHMTWGTDLTDGMFRHLNVRPGGRPCARPPGCGTSPAWQPPTSGCAGAP